MAEDSLDGKGAGDHDVPYEYHQPTWTWYWPFTWREFMHLLILRGQLQNNQIKGDTWPEEDAANDD